MSFSYDVSICFWCWAIAYLTEWRKERTGNGPPAESPVPTPSHAPQISKVSVSPARKAEEASPPWDEEEEKMPVCLM